MSALAGLELTAHSARSAPEPALEALHALDAGFEVEARPDEPPTPLATLVAHQRALPSYRDRTLWLAGSAGLTVGAATVDIERTDDNQHLLEAWIVVDPAHRRRGVGRRLLERVVDLAEAEGRTLLMGYTHSGVPAGAAFLEWLGAKAGLVERESELELATLDRSLIDRWLSEGPQRAPGYELLVLEGDLPDELLVPFAQLHEVTNTAPRDDLDMEDRHRTPEQIRASEQSRREAGGERILCIARHAASGALAGWTELGRHPAQPWKVEQYWTAVHPDHRGLALGKWLKAANVVRALERWPDAGKIVTGNAYSNDAMIGINTELGFRETSAWTAWQVPVAQMRDRLAA